MFVVDFKCYGKENQYKSIDEAIRTAQYLKKRNLLINFLNLINNFPFILCSA
jgi:hypothetical protein